MTEVQYKQASDLWGKIQNCEGRIENLLDERNSFNLPQELYERHQTEIRNALHAELAMLRAAFAVL